MKKISFTLVLIGICLVTFNTSAYSKTINDSDTPLRKTLGYALINTLREPIDEAIAEIYKDDKNAPEGLTWATYDTEILKVKQLNGIGGAYEITLKVRPYYRAHNTYGEDIVIVNTNRELVDFEHLRTYPING